MVRRQPGGEQPVNHRRDDGRAGAVDGPGGGKNLDADDVLRGNQAAPGFGDGRFAGEIGDAAIDHVLNEGGVRLVLVGGVWVFDDQDACVRAAGLPQRQIGGLNLQAGKPEGAYHHQPAKRLNELGQCVS